MNAEELYYEYEHIAEQTIYRMFNSPYNVARRNNIELEDLFQYAKTGLWKGIITFDENKKTKLKTHLINHVRWHTTERLKRECKAEKQLRLVPMETSLGDDENDNMNYHDVLGSEYNLEQDADCNLDVDKLLSLLDDRDRDIVKMKMGKFTNVQIGAKWSTTPQNINDRIRRAKEKIGNYLEVVGI